MNRVLCGAMLLAGSGHALSQCGMTTEIIMSVDCNQASSLVNTSGGVGPYTIVIERYLGTGGQPDYVTEVTTTDPDGDLSLNLPLNIWGWSYGARVTVTDANNCVAADHSDYYWSVLNYWLNDPSHQVDCVNGVSRMVVVLPGSSTPPTYSISPGTTNGSFLADWTSLGSDAWRLNTPLANGSYYVEFPQYMEVNVGINCLDGASVSINDNVSPGDCGVNFRMKAALDGALPSGTLMTDALRAANLIPTTQPYTALGYTFVGSPTNVSISPSLLALTGNNAIVDWVVVELRSSLTMVAWSKPALLQRDGDVVDTDGNDYLNFPITAGSYHIALRHRNHLGVMTSTTRALTLNPSSNLIDFRSASTGSYGTSAQVLKGTVQCLWASDATGNGTINYTGSGNDRDPILTAIGGTTPNAVLTDVYDRRDVNMDGMIKYTGANNDRDPILTNVGSTTPNNTRTQQLP